MSKPRALSSFVNGRFLIAEGQTRWPVIQPQTGLTSATLFEADITEVGHAVFAAERALPRWRVHADRDALLEKMGERILSERTQLAQLLAESTGISRLRALQHIERGAQYFLPLSTAQFFYPPTQFSFDYLREPLGVVAIVCGWHKVFPLACQKISMALRLGNCVVLKPSEYAAPVFDALCQLLPTLGLPPGVLNVVNGRDDITGPALVNHPNIAAVVFAGRASNSQDIALQALRTGKKFIDASAKKPTHIVLADAPFESTLGYLFSSIFLHPHYRQGVARILLQAQVASQFMTRLGELVETLSADIPFLSPENGAMESAAILDLLPHTQLVQQIAKTHQNAIEKGGVCIAGTPQESLHTNYPQACSANPSIWMAPALEHLCNSETWHGCALTVIHSLDEAAKTCVQARWRASSIWTTDSALKQKAQQQLPTARLGINTLFDQAQSDACDALDDFHALSQLKICAQA